MWNAGLEPGGRLGRGTAGLGASPRPSLREAATHTALLDLAPDAIFARDAERRITFWNRGATNTYGFSQAEALGLAPRNLLRTEYPIPLEEIERIVTERGVWQGDLVQRTKEGRRVMVESRWAAQYEEGGGLAGILEINRDLTARLRSQTALLELSPDAIVGIGGDGLIVLANGQTEALFGYAREELLGQPIELLVPERFQESHIRLRDGYIGNPSTRPMGAGLELFGRRRDGGEFPTEISLSSIETEEGTLAIAAIRDGSERLAASRERERLKAEAERERLQNRLHQAERLESLGQLAGGIAHDFNNLLAVIINYAAFVSEELDRGGPTEEGRQALWTDVEQISLAAEKAAHLTHQLLVFARRGVVQPEVIDVNEVVANIEQLLRRTLGEHIELDSSLAPDLSAVVIDPGQLEQILVNLAVNARDAMPDGGTLRIDTASVEVDESYANSRPDVSPGAHVRVRVSDTGVGMSSETVSRAFDPFFTTKPSGRGTGLGLATVYGIIQQAGGRTQIYSEPGVGTTFTVLLPATEEVVEAAEPMSGAETLRGDETILLVEDEPALCEVTRRILAGAGYEVLIAAGGAEALELAQAHGGQIDLLLSDVVMPQMAGTQVAEHLRGTRPSTRVLLMSGFAQPILDAGGHLDPGVAFIEKPFSGASLLLKVAQILNREGRINAGAAGSR